MHLFTFPVDAAPAGATSDSTQSAAAHGTGTAEADHGTFLSVSLLTMSHAFLTPMHACQLNP